jgi:small GTP-binding protein
MIEMDDDNNYEYLFKLIVVGDSGTGKSCLVTRYADDEFKLDTKSTIGVEFKTVDVMLNGKTVKLQIWDTAGQERFRAITSAYYRGAVGVLMVYDITKRKTFLDIDKWLFEIKENCLNGVNIILVGNKSDLSAMREVSSEEAKKYAESHTKKGFPISFIETSALDKTNVEVAFLDLAKNILHEAISAEENKTDPRPQITGQRQTVDITTNIQIPPNANQNGCPC